MGLRRWIEAGLLTLLLGAIGLTAGDWAIWSLRGRPLGHVVLTRMVVAPLKGNREEYYPDGTEVDSCSRSLLPWTGAGACWKVKQKPLIFER